MAQRSRTGRTARSYGVAAAVVLGSLVGTAGVASAELLAVRMGPDPLATNGGSFTITITSNPSCPEACPVGLGNMVLNESSYVDVTFDRDSTELSVVDGALGIEDFEVSFNLGGGIQISNATLTTDPDAPIDVDTVGSFSGPFVLALSGLLNADATVLGFPPLAIEDQGATINVGGTFTFDPVLGTFEITDVGSLVGPETVTIGSITLRIEGEFELSFIGTADLALFSEDFESGDFGGWGLVVPLPL